MALVQTEDTERREWLAIEFERHRAHLRAVGYRMLGSMTEADDAVQEAWIRLQRRDPGDTHDLRGWLTVTVGRICLDMLRSRKSRRETYAGTWLPEPLVTWPGAGGHAESNPEADAVMADSVGIALLVVLETLSPPERLAFVLHDVFGVGFDEIAVIVDRTPAATRQLASRARRRVRAEAPEPDADLAVQRQVIDAFVAAARAGDFEALLRVLDPDVVVTTDGGGRGPFARPPLRGCRRGRPSREPDGRAFRVVRAAGHRQRAGGTRRRRRTWSAAHHRVVPAAGGQDRGDPVQRRSGQDAADHRLGSAVCDTGRVSDPRHVVSVTESIWVACPPEAVWDYTQDFTRRTEWDAGIAEATILQQDPRTVRVKVAGLGRMTVVYQLDRRPERTSAAFVDVESAWVSGGGGSWEYEAADGGTRWQQTNSLELKRPTPRVPARPAARARTPTFDETRDGRGEAPPRGRASLTCVDDAFVGRDHLVDESFELAV